MATSSPSDGKQADRWTDVETEIRAVLARGASGEGPLDATSFSVESGSTLCCACSKQKAAEGRCHRVWAAAALARAGWNVILDGIPVASSDTRGVDVFVRDADPSETARTAAGIPCNPLFPWAVDPGSGRPR